MTAPAQPPDPRVQRIASAMGTWQHTPGDQSHVDLARVLVEELGGREVSDVEYRYLGEPAERPTDGITLQNGEVITWRDKQWHLWDAGRSRTAWYLSDLIQCVTFCCSDTDLRALLALQQRENVETIKALEGRVETAEAANTELDNARKSAEQSARDLRENNATLRAELDAINTKTEHDQALMDTQAKLIVDLETELDAIKGAQVPYRWTVVVKDRISFTFTSLGSAQTWANGEGGEVIPLYRHHAPALPAKGDGCEFCLGAKGGVEGNGNRFNGILVCDYCTALLLDAKKSPALPVVGACVMNDKGEVTHRWSDRWLARDMDVLEVIARKENGTLYKLLLGDKIGAPLPTEGGK